MNGPPLNGKAAPHKWTKAQDGYITARRKAGAKMREIAEELEMTVRQVEHRIYHLQSAKNVPPEQRPPIPETGAVEWKKGTYWRQPPKAAWSRGFTGRLIHISATARDFMEDKK